MQAVSTSINLGGVSHLNFAFAKPFEPLSPFLKKIEIENAEHSKENFSHYKVIKQTSKLDDQFWSDVVASEYPVLVVGPTYPNEDISSITELAKILNAPILIEVGSNVPNSKYSITAFDGFLRNTEIRENLKPDLILRFGAEPISKAISNYLLAYKECKQIRFITKNHFKDETLSSTNGIAIDGSLEIPEISGSTDKNWLKNWRDYQKNYLSFKEKELFPSSPLTDGYVFKSLTPLIPEDSFIMTSNSFPVRDLSLFGEYGSREVFVNRGAAGIDGITSTAFGISISKRKTGVLFIGDIAFLHDTNALLNAHKILDTLIIVVLNNGGGTIFRMLPINDYKKKYTEYFETPHSVTISALCRAYKIQHSLIFKHEQLVKYFTSMLKQPSVHVLECMTDPDNSMTLRNQFWGYSETEK